RIMLRHLRRRRNFLLSLRRANTVRQSLPAFTAEIPSVLHPLPRLLATYHDPPQSTAYLTITTRLTSHHSTWTMKRFDQPQSIRTGEKFQTVPQCLRSIKRKKSN